MSQLPPPKNPPSQNLTFKEWLVENVKFFSLAFLILFTFRSSFFEPYRIPSGSMIPTLRVGDFIMVNKMAYGLKLPLAEYFVDDPVYLSKPKAPERGDVVVFKVPPEIVERVFSENDSRRGSTVYYVKRVMGLPNDRIKVRDKIVYINDKPLERQPLNKPEIITQVDDLKSDVSLLELFEETVPPTQRKHFILHNKNNFFAENSPEFLVPEGHMFVMGDNRDNSQDSREIGFIPLKFLRGRALFVWLSLWIEPKQDLYIFKPSRIGTGIH